MLADNKIQTGLSHLGKPYVYGAPSYQAYAYDCSSFIQYIFFRKRVF